VTHLHIGVHITNFVSTLRVFHSFKNCDQGFENAAPGCRQRAAFSSASPNVQKLENLYLEVNRTLLVASELTN